MQEERMQRRQPRPVRSTIIRAVAALTATGLLLAACGGDSGNGGTTGHTLHTLIVNASDVDVTVSYTDSEDVILPTCTAVLQDFPLADPFVLSIDGEAVIDSDVDLADGLPNDGESDLIVEVDIAKDGTTSIKSAVRPGSGLTKPGKSSYCPSLPGS